MTVLINRTRSSTVDKPGVQGKYVFLPTQSYPTVRRNFTTHESFPSAKTLEIMSLNCLPLTLNNPRTKVSFRLRSQNPEVNSEPNHKDGVKRVRLKRESSLTFVLVETEILNSLYIKRRWTPTKRNSLMFCFVRS